MTVEDALQQQKQQQQQQQQQQASPNVPVTSPGKVARTSSGERTAGGGGGGGDFSGGGVVLEGPSNAPPLSFEKYKELYPSKAKKCLNQLKEVTSVVDQDVLTEALNRGAKRGLGDFQECVPGAIEWILEKQKLQHLPILGQMDVAPTKSPLRLLKLNQSSNENMPPAVAMNRAEASTGGITQPPNSPNQINPLVDLTDNPDNAKDSAESDLQRAIKLSLQETSRNPAFGGHFTQEDQDVSRALEASLMETQLNGTKRKRGETWIDPLNPHDRERNGLWPVGLKNVGQTCWFSAVIQSLFYLSAFRNLVLNFQPPPHFQQPPPNGLNEVLTAEEEKERKICEFMCELRRLFALMVASERKYVDPTKAVEILRGFIGSSSQNAVCSENQQEDVSEFTHILFAWVEEAFKKPLKATSSSREEKMEEGCNVENQSPNSQHQQQQAHASETDGTTDNPMAKLFYGRINVEGTVQGERFSRHEAFTQHALQVNDFADIHDSLENSTANEALGSASSQERWFTDLPPVLLFSLSRFEFNIKKGMAEKIHNRFDFPVVMFMDRYMATNKEVTRHKREQVRVLKGRREELKATLERFVSYGSGEQKMALPTILQYTMDFAGSSLADVNMASPPSETGGGSGGHVVVAVPSTTNLMQVDSPCHSPKMTAASSLNNIAAGDASATTQTKDDFAPMDVEMGEDLEEGGHGCDKTMTTTREGAATASAHPVVVPCPKHVTAMELSVIQSCISRWQKEVLGEIATLEASIQKIDDSVATMYSEESLNKLAYRLHAVMVHEGSVNSGHYWAYIFDHKRKVWMKFNDNSVTEANWDELQRESVGGHSNTSAYSLVYLEEAKTNIILDSPEVEEEDNKMEHELLDALIRILPNDLAVYVIEDNKAFQTERERWDEEQEEKKKQEALASLQKQDEADSSNDLQVVEERLTYVNTHAKLCTDTSYKILKSVEKIAVEKGAIVALQAAVDAASHMNAERHNSTDEAGQAVDHRLESFVIYLERNKVHKQLIRLALLEQFSLPGLDNEIQTSAIVRKAAEQQLKQTRIECPDEAALLKEWHQAYHLFRVSAQCFVRGTEAYFTDNLDEGLDLLTVAYSLSVQIIDRAPMGHFKSLRTGPLVKYLCLSLKAVNDNLIKLFKLGERLPELKQSVDLLIVPVLYLLQQRVNRAEQAASSQSSSSSSDGGGGGGGGSTLAARTLEEVRHQWCSLLGDAGSSGKSLLPAEASEVVSEFLTVILEPAEPRDLDAKSRNCDHIDQQSDLSLSVRFREALKRAKQEQVTA